MTIYTNENCARNTSVVNMDTTKGDVTSYVWPLTDGRGKPVLFHCYGLLTPTPI